MKSSMRLYALLLAAISPLATSGQRGDRGSGDRRRPAAFIPPASDPQSTPVVVPVANVNSQPAAVIPNPGVINPNPNIVDIQGGNGDAITTAETPTGTNTGDGGGVGGGGSCAAVSGNMNIQLSGDSVDFRFEPQAAGNPTSGNTGDCNVWTLPPGWSGRIHVGGDAAFPVSSTLYEASIQQDGTAAMDVSFVEAYSVPMVCTDNGNGYVSGCGIDLFSLGTPCPTGGSNGFCKNPQGPGGSRDSSVKWCWACSPPDPLFGPCSAAAYTFPTDDAATNGDSSLDISCVIGSSSLRTGREGDTATAGYPQPGRCEVCTDGTKRSLEDMLFGREKVSPIARTSSMLPKVRRRSVIDVPARRSHQHGTAAHGSKIR
ncbi:MAG: hypothetical protein Q9208_006948 [Pyrenodesmia sp. 3 TL-2023]